MFSCQYLAENQRISIQKRAAYGIARETPEFEYELDLMWMIRRFILAASQVLKQNLRIHNAFYKLDIIRSFQQNTLKLGAMC